ncbi:coiled-coil domain-containing protein 201 [Microcaecilia unicolor]|uniref:Coiled-coil domain-containing protein 201-like n=1 Tax=Microcaecilia unicolor TaxID=1415580 RepID=A0A6P7X031_9AMPH|nr:coiled-coil domain-containing protein 201-like [Microcaecilia unicolor]
MSEEEYSFLNVKRYSRKMLAIKHSTPLMETANSDKLSSEDILEQTNQELHAENIKGQRPRTPYPFKWSLRDDLMYHPGIKSLSTIHRTRLSTVLASEESIEGSSSNIDHNTERGAKETGTSSPKGVPLRVSGIPGIRDKQEQRKKMTKEKRLSVLKRIRRWEIRQLNNIEEATTHELVIEEA